MRPCRGVVGTCTLLLFGALAVPAEAAWDNVFQVTCFRCKCKQQATQSYYYAPAPACCPPAPVCTTQYRMRSFYQPVTHMETRSYYEPVTEYRTSYYWEPVRSVRYSMYYDPGSCSWQQQACPTTRLELRSQSCPVQSWVARCTTVPVTTQQVAYYWEPVANCCTPTAPAAPVYPAPNAPVYPAPNASLYPPTIGGQPGVGESRTPTSPGVSEGRSPYIQGSNPQNYQQYPRTTLPASNSAPPPMVRMDKIVAIPKSDVPGAVVSAKK